MVMYLLTSKKFHDFGVASQRTRLTIPELDGKFVHPASRFQVCVRCTSSCAATTRQHTPPGSEKCVFGRGELASFL